MKAIQTMSLTKKYRDVTAVDGLNLTVEQGELFALLGVNGAGKTTTIKMLSCLSLPTGGQALVYEKNVVTQAHDVKALIGVSPQETAVAPNLSVEENLALMCGVYGLSAARTKERVAELAQRMNLSEVLHRKAGKLSGGWQRRLSIAMALISEPKLLFLDEPTLGLDVLARSDLWELIRSLKGRMTIILTTHYMEEAQALSDRVGIMRSGRLLEVGAPQEIMRRADADTLEKAFVRIVKGGKTE